MPEWEEFKPVLKLQDRKEDLVEQLKLQWRDGKRWWSQEDVRQWIRTNSIHRELDDFQVQDFLKELEMEGNIRLHGLKERYMDVLGPDCWGKGKQVLDYKKELTQHYLAAFQRFWGEGPKTWSKKEVETIAQHEDPRKSLADEEVKDVIEDMAHGGYVIFHGNEDVYLEVTDPTRWNQRKVNDQPS